MKTFFYLIAILFSLQSCCYSSEKQNDSAPSTTENTETTRSRCEDTLNAIADTCNWCSYCFYTFGENTYLCVESGQSNADATFRVFSLEKDVPKCIFETWAANSYFMKCQNKIYRWSSHMDVDWYTLIEEKDGKIIETVLCRTELQPGTGYVVTDGSRDNILNLSPKQNELQWQEWPKSANNNK